MNLIFSNKKPVFLFLFFLISTYSNVFAQEISYPKPAFWDNVRFGGSLGANFSDDYLSGFLAPKAVYDFNKFASAGTGVAGSFTNAPRYTAYAITGSIIGLFRPLPSIQLSTEFEENYVSRTISLEGGNREESYWYPALFLGAGYTTGNLTMGIRYDVLYDQNKSMYRNAYMPFVSVYF